MGAFKALRQHAAGSRFDQQRELKHAAADQDTALRVWR